MTNSPLVLDLSLAVDRSLINEAGHSLRYLVASVRASAPEAEKSPRLRQNIALVIDRSGSMGGGRLQSAKQAAIGLAEALSGGRGAGDDASCPELPDMLSVVVFDDEVETILPPTEMTENGKQAAVDAITKVRRGGMTNLAGGYQAGALHVAEVMEQGFKGANRVIILSDGHANVGLTHPAALAEHASALAARDVITSSVGIGDGYDEGLMHAIAQAGGGQLHDAETPEEIVEVLVGELEEAFQLAATNTTVALDIGDEFEVQAFGYPGARSAGQLRVNLGSIRTGVERRIVFQLKFRRGEIGDGVDLTATASATDARDGTRVTSKPARETLTYAPRRDLIHQVCDQTAARHAASTWKAQLVTEATGLNRDGNRDGVRALIERALPDFKRLARLFPEGEAMVRELQSMIRHSRRDWSSRTRKEMMLQSSKVMSDSLDYRVMERRAWSELLEDEVPPGDVD
jgi:Ca-activated chloride channel family protein